MTFLAPAGHAAGIADGVAGGKGTKAQRHPGDGGGEGGDDDTHDPK